MGYYFNKDYIQIFPMNMALRLLNIGLITFQNLYTQDFLRNLESVKFILEKNNLNFDNEYFNQIKGTAIGTLFAPT